MKYSIFYTQKNENTKYLDDVEEIRIEYNPNDKTLPDFLEMHQGRQRITISIAENVNWFDLIDLFRAGKVSKENISLMMPLSMLNTDSTLYEMAKDLGLHVYFSDTIVSWDLLEDVSLLTDEIIIGGSLGFDMDAVRYFTEHHHLTLHVCPHVCSGSAADPVKQFFILPEDVSIYEGYVDYFDITALGPVDPILKSYLQEKWFGDAGPIILGLPLETLDGRRYLPLFAARRLNCKKKCIKGGSCNMCHNFATMQKMLEEKDIWIRKEDKYKVIN